MASPFEIFLLFLILVAIPLPAYIIGRRRGVAHAWVAFIPLVGATVVFLWAINRSGWIGLVSVIPLLGLIVWIVVAVEMPRTHDRPGWWAPVLILVPGVGLYLYAFTLDAVAT